MDRFRATFSAVTIVVCVAMAVLTIVVENRVWPGALVADMLFSACVLSVPYGVGILWALVGLRRAWVAAFAAGYTAVAAAASMLFVAVLPNDSNAGGGFVATLIFLVQLGLSVVGLLVGAVVTILDITIEDA
jgi:hypothetical protein